MTDQSSEVETLVAAFPAPERAKAAVATLELAGVAHRDIQLMGGARSVGRHDRDADAGMARAMARQWRRGALIGAPLGIAVALVAAWIFDLDPLVFAGAIVGGAVAGAFVGGFLAAGLAQPRTSSVWDVYLLDHDTNTCLSVVARGNRGSVEALLRRAGATSVERVPSDGAAPS